MRHNFVDRYAALDSPLHMLDARTKLIGFTGLIVAVLFVPADRTLSYFALFFFTAILMGISQVPLTYIVGRTLVLLPFVLLAGLARPWSNGLDWARFGGLVLRSTLCLILLVLMTNTTRFAELLRALRRLGCPRILVTNLAFLYRYVFVLTEEVLRMRQARDCRRVGRLPLRTEVKTLGSMLGTLLIRSFERAERMYQAMLSRGYAGALPIIDARPFTWRDMAFLACLTALIFLTLRR